VHELLEHLGGSNLIAERPELIATCDALKPSLGVKKNQKKFA
jgi:hypothetical protein